SGYQGAALAMSGDAAGATTTDASGNYSFAGLLNGNYTVTPSVSGQTLSPVSLSPTISGAASTGNDFALDTYALSGQVTLSGSGYQGAALTMSGDAAGATTTDASGNYSFAVLNGNYTVTPSVSGQTLSPVSLSPTISGAASTGNDFALDTYALSGQVTRNGSGFTGITVDLTGVLAGSDVTDGSGIYSFAVLNGGYTVTPMLYNQLVSPASSTFTVSSSPVMNVDFSTSFIVWHVDQNATSTTIDGLSWDTAFMHPQNGADRAASGDQIWVAGGTYQSMDTTVPTVPVLTLPANVEVYGSFAGSETSLAERQFTGNSTILDGINITEQIVVAADNTLIDGFHLTNAEGILDVTQAAVNAGSVTNFRLFNSVVSNNFTPRAGQTGSSGLSIIDGEVRNVKFSGNVGRNGPIYVLRGSTGNVEINNALFINNDALYGGGLVIAGDGNNVTINNSTIADNAATYGPGIFIDMGPGGGGLPFGNVVITNSIVMGGIDGATSYPSPTISYSNIEGMGASPSASIIDTNPQFINAASSNYKLDSTSPVIDAGDNAAVPSSLTGDIARNNRILDGPDVDTIATVDMGAYEYVMP
ncbi:MAG: hypothetical protein ACC669_06820, partial [bacterium]